MLASRSSLFPSTSFTRTQVGSDEDADGDIDDDCKPALALLSMSRWTPSLSLAATPVLRASALSSPAASRSPSPYGSIATKRDLDASSPEPTARSSSPEDHAARPFKRQRVNVPAPVPNLTKKSRGRRVPRADDAEVQKDAARKYVCPVPECGKGFSRGEHLKRHTRSIHTNDRPFTCPVKGCNRTFTRHDNLLQHQRAHATPLLVPNNDRC
ncbi:hypothetical protein EXIGLDRAFT_726801 [Exidia glandulosa HHB12029]|uniref:C2H2-type domain-containing protein n=1 Tax=Exidia glandulosa HHB12029 TaxID=1314781 RepID=A0A165M8I8_EXIGL|nr:hypothetical protein EXIGLDRAFT_726801 [Exidia glandulosa HHB12029]